MHENKVVFIRRSRGYAPEPILIRRRVKRCSLGLGSEKNNTACLLLGDKAFISQHIGDVENIETLEFLEEASNRLIQLTNGSVEAVACDLHPKFASTILAKKLSEENGWAIIQVQHHYAHVAALMAEHNVDEIIGICCDGYGYGLDGKAWGGEIILGVASDRSLEFKRLGHLQEQPLIGGDLATLYPLRMAAGILYGRTNVEDWLMENSSHLPHGETEAHLILSQLKRGVKNMTTSCGRILDAASAIIGICYERTYEGEPAMKLESAALGGKDYFEIKPIINGGVLDTTAIIMAVFEGKEKISRRDLAFSFQAYLARGLAQLAIEKALENGINTIGFSGGVACNQIITQIMREIIEQHGLRFFTHEVIPPGDGGISLGQAFTVSLS
jgi:hydrogenase maturation protein HypF